MLILQKLEELAENQPYALAVISEVAMLNYKTLNHLVWQSALWMQKNGVHATSRVGLSFNSQMTHLVASLAVLRLGTAQVALPASEPELARKKIVIKAEASVIISDFSGESFGLERLLLDLPAMMDGKEPAAHHLSLSGQDQDAPAMIVTGSGTTGEPKVFVSSYASMDAKIRRRASSPPTFSQERFFSVTAFDYYSSKQDMFCCLATGGTGVLREKRQSSIIAICDRLAVDHLELTAVQAYRLLDQVLLEEPVVARLSRLKSLRVGSSPVSDELFSRLRQRLSPHCYIRYALNEFGVATLLSSTNRDRVSGSVGKSVAGVDLEVVDKHDQPCPAGVTGLIRMRAEGMFDSYEGNPEATAKALRNGWYYPGDVGQFDLQGELIFKGRTDDLIIYEGVNIYPREIEDVLEQHPAVLEAAVFPLTLKGNQVPAAAVRVSMQVSEKELLDFCRQYINWRTPRWILLMDEFPRNAAGKILKREIRELLGKKLKA